MTDDELIKEMQKQIVDIRIGYYAFRAKAYVAEAKFVVDLGAHKQRIEKLELQLKRAA